MTTNKPIKIKSTRKNPKEGCSGCGKRIKRNNLRQRNNSRKKIKKKF